VEQAELIKERETGVELAWKGREGREITRTSTSE
jgi:hypothetical protein